MCRAQHAAAAGVPAPQAQGSWAWGTRSAAAVVSRSLPQAQPSVAMTAQQVAAHAAVVSAQIICRQTPSGPAAPQGTVNEVTPACAGCIVR